MSQHYGHACSSTFPLQTGISYTPLCVCLPTHQMDIFLWIVTRGIRRSFCALHALVMGSKCPAGLAVILRAWWCMGKGETRMLRMNFAFTGSIHLEEDIPSLCPAVLSVVGKCSVAVLISCASLSQVHAQFQITPLCPCLLGCSAQRHQVLMNDASCELMCHMMV